MGRRVHNVSQVRLSGVLQNVSLVRRSPRPAPKVKKINVLARSSNSSPGLNVLRTDNGGEYFSAEIKHYLAENRIEQQLTVAYTRQRKGAPERMNRTLIDFVRSILHSKGLAKPFYAEALSTPAYSRNRVTLRSLPSNTTPFHLWIGKAPDLSHLRVFGSKFCYFVPKSKLKKLDPRSKVAIMVGYLSQSKEYKLWHLETKTIVVLRDFTFHESDDNSVYEIDATNTSIRESR